MNNINKRQILPAVFASLLLICAGLETAAADDQQERFAAAMQAIEDDRLNTARRILSALLADFPTLHRARLELARVNYLARDYSTARDEAQRVLDDPATPPAVRTTVLAFLAQIRADEESLGGRHYWRPSIYLGAMYDSNVNFGISRDIVDVNGVPFRVNPDSRERSDVAGVIDAGLSHSFNPNIQFESGEQTGTFLWQSHLNAYYRSYFDENDFNLGILTLRTGPTWVVPGHWRASVGLQADQIWLGGDSLALFSSLNPSISWEFGGRNELTLEGIATHRSYSRSRDSGREGWYGRAGVRYTRYFNERKLGLQLGGGYFKFDADDDRFAYSGPDVFAGVVWQAWQYGSVYARVGYREYDFDGVEPGFDRSRDDEELRATVGFRHDLQSGWLNKWTVLGDVTVTDNESPGVSIFEYDRYQISLGLSRSF